MQGDQWSYKTTTVSQARDYGGSEQVLVVEGSRNEQILNVEYQRIWSVAVWSSV